VSEGTPHENPAESTFYQLTSFGIQPARTAWKSPWQNGVAERWIGSVRRELLDHVTQHLTAGHLVDIAGDAATCRCDFVIRRWPADDTDDGFLRSYGFYAYALRREHGGWRISGITQVVRRSEGDRSLHGGLRPPGSRP